MVKKLPVKKELKKKNMQRITMEKLHGDAQNMDASCVSSIIVVVNI